MLIIILPSINKEASAKILFFQKIQSEFLANIVSFSSRERQALSADLSFIILPPITKEE